ncbi:hypothetical protein BMS3Abin08_01258 [bacterium BMS3Abin08]|nr:hypothetical protein BMS3Abin08_01258 [bacterium BMS3Abin08]
MLDDTCYFLGFEGLSEAIFVWAILNSEHIQKLLASLTFLDAKRPYTKDVLMRLSVDKVADHMTYHEIIDQIKSLDETMLSNVGENTWNVFRGQKEQMQLRGEINQPSLFL